MNHSNDRDEPQAAIAIVGMSCIFPGAPDLDSYWKNIINGVDAISDVPEQRWESNFYDPNSSSVDRFYCRRGGFVDDYVDFDPLQFGIMPKAAEGADPDQLLSLRVGAEALADAGYDENNPPLERTGVMIGRGNYLAAGIIRLEQNVRMVQQIEQTISQVMPDVNAKDLQRLRESLQAQIGHYGPDTAVGLMPNLVASRLANRLNLKGPAYTVDAACASSLLAVEQAVQQLRNGSLDMALTGGLHFTHDVAFWSVFCQLGALSRNQQIRPFDQRADGILAGEGIGMMVLKRLEDAEQNNDRIYAVIKGVSTGSDGRATSLLTPAVAGQVATLESAWAQTDCDKNQLALLEAHGTGTPNGDAAELETLARFFGPAASDQTRASLGSVKSMIGHAMPAAGVAGLIKTTLAVYHGQLPPTLHCEQPNPEIEKTRFKLQAQVENWPDQSPTDGASIRSRLAAVNAFGFGGINSHAIIESHHSSHRVAHQAHGMNPPIKKSTAHVAPPVAVACFAAATPDALLSQLKQGANAAINPKDYPELTCRLAIVDPNDKKIEQAQKIIARGHHWPGRNGIFYSPDPLLSNGGKLAFVFPGVDSQFQPKIDDVAKFLDTPIPPYAVEADPAEKLGEVSTGLLGVNRLLFQALNKLNIKADVMAGHSIGEWSALEMSGSWSADEVEAINAEIDLDTLAVPDVVFLAAGCGIDIIKEASEGCSDLHISHDNCPHQSIVCGPEAEIQTLLKTLQTQKVFCQILPFSSGFHSPLFSNYIKPYQDCWAGMSFAQPHTPLWSATSCQPYPETSEQRRDLACEHLTQAVRFRELTEALHKDGARVFIQVGTGSLNGFINDSLKGRPHLALQSNINKRSGMEQLTHINAALWAEGLNDATALLAQSQPSNAEDKIQIKPKQQASASSMKLKLGVPIVVLEDPPQLSTAKTAFSSSDHTLANDDMQRMFQEVIHDMQSASADVLQAWQQQQTSPAVSIHPPLSNQTTQQGLKNGTIVKTLDLGSTIPLIRDHAFFPQREGWENIEDTNPVIPLTLHIELMRSAVEELMPDKTVVRMENLTAFKWLQVATPIDIRIVIEAQNATQLKVRIDGYSSCEITVADAFPVTQCQHYQLANERSPLIDAQHMYDKGVMFHGPSFQGITTLGPISDEGIRGIIKTPAGPGALLDNAGQLMGYWATEIFKYNRLIMPIGIEKIEFFSTEPLLDSIVECSMRLYDISDDSCKADMEISHNGHTWIRIKGWEDRRYHMDDRLLDLIQQAQWNTLSDYEHNSYVKFNDIYDKAITRDYIVGRLLTAEEKSDYSKIPPRRRRQWVNGRAAAKDAVRHMLWQTQKDKPIYPGEIKVRNATNGRPFVESTISHIDNDAVNISIAHKDHLAVAIAGLNESVGIDIEKIEPRDDSFVELAFQPEEIALLPETNRDQAIATMWAAKEAVAKLQGTGLQGRPKDFIINHLCENEVQVNNQHRVKTNLSDNYVICWTRSS